MRAASLSALLVSKGSAQPIDYSAWAAAVRSPAVAVTPLAPIASVAVVPVTPAKMPARIRRRAKPAEGSKDGARFKYTLRLDPDRHLRVRLVAAHLERSMQDIMTTALDTYLERAATQVQGGNCACLTGQPAGDACCGAVSKGACD